MKRTLSLVMLFTCVVIVSGFLGKVGLLLPSRREVFLN
jgi:hypothetical protein